MPIRGDGDGLMDGGQASNSRDQEKIVYVLHPNCAVEEV